MKQCDIEELNLLILSVSMWYQGHLSLNSVEVFLVIYNNKWVMNKL